MAFHLKPQRISEPTDAGPQPGARARVFYVSYDGIGEPLGRSQVLGYLFRLCGDFEITLISFEKPEADLVALREELGRRGIGWVALSYHRRPPVLSTLLDVLRGVLALRSAASRGRPRIVHVRSYVPALIALLARRYTGGCLLFDIRGFWADERVEGGLWPRGGMLYRIAKRCERWFFAEADAVVTLTDASVDQVNSWVGERDVPVVVIPTCVDLERFTAAHRRRTGDPHAVWCGSIGTWYRFDLVVPLARALGLPLEVLTRQTDLAFRELDGWPASVRSQPPEAIPGELFAGDIGLCLVASSFSKLASAPTRFAEYLAAGMPVVVSRRVGDLEEIVERERVGVVLRGEDDAAIRACAAAAQALAAEPDIAERCRRVAAREFDVNVGSDRYRHLYVSLIGGSPGPAQARPT